MGNERIKKARETYGIPESANQQITEKDIALAERVQKQVDQINIDDQITLLTQIIAETREIHLAKRFSRKRTIGENLGLSDKQCPTDICSFPDATEEQHKKAQLVGNLVSIRSKLLSINHMLKAVFLDIEMSQHEFDE